jgi:hypothetical protein
MKNLVITGLTAIVVVVLMAAVLALVTQWAYVGVLVTAFGFPTITLLQAFQLNLLAGLLVKSTLSTSSSK